jgi:Zn-dependent M28 family amino/carboxypeptidase
VSVSLRLTNDVQRAQTANVIARLPGCDTAVASEAVIYTAHHDHLGVKPEAQPGDDAIYNGALDNASGVAGLLSLAQALKALERVPRRSVLFAAVAAEEQGLLGSEYLAHHLPLPAGRVAANVNIHGLNILGRTRDLPAVGLGKSTVDDYLIALARMQGREIVPDAFPDRGFFYRSDQLNFARIGVPAAYLDQGVEVLGKPPGWGKQQVEKFEATDYHQPSDELRDTWDLAGAVEDLQLLFHLGVKIANSPRKPVWKAGDEFEAARKAALQAIGE